MELYTSSILESLVYYRLRSIRTAVAYSNNAKNDDYGCKICRDLFFFKPCKDDHVIHTGHIEFYELDLDSMTTN